ncbi:MAG: hypothetical protein U0031_23975 [Thermomicrobiales bacterium]
MRNALSRQTVGIGLTVLITSLATIGPAAAQDATPTAEESVNQRVVAPAECTADPVASDALATMLNLNGEGVPSSAPPVITPPLGTTADEATAEAIRDATRSVIACFNAEDIPRAAALMTEHGVQRVYGSLTTSDELRATTRDRLAATPEPRAEDQMVRLIAATEPIVLSDGRVASFVVINEPLLPPSGPETLLFVFAEQDGRWLLDDLVDFSVVPLPTGKEATPTA